MSSHNHGNNLLANLDSFEHFIGYYEWEGHACRIRRDEAQPHILHSEIYIPGKGFLPFSLTDIVLDAYPIQDDSFKRLVVAGRLRKSQSN